MGSSAKTGKFFIGRVTGALLCIKNIKVPFVIGHPPTYTSYLVYMCAGRFRGHKSSNRIELSRLVQDLLNFGVLGSLRLWGGGRWVGGIWGHGGCPHTQAHACTCTHAHLYMYRNCKWPPTLRHPCLACLTCMCMRACMCVHACACVHAWDIPPYTHTNLHPHTPICHPLGEPPESLKIR